MKAIIVIDMPNSCDKCEFGYYSDGKILLCDYENKIGSEENKPDWCPLKELPEKIPRPQPIESDEFNRGFCWGWNDCIDEILGEE